MESPRPVFVVPSLNSFRKGARAAMASVSRVGNAVADKIPVHPVRRSIARKNPVPASHKHEKRVREPVVATKAPAASHQPIQRRAVTVPAPAQSKTAEPASLVVRRAPQVAIQKPKAVVLAKPSSPSPRPAESKVVPSRKAFQLPTPPPTPPLGTQGQGDNVASAKKIQRLIVSTPAKNAAEYKTLVKRIATPSAIPRAVKREVKPTRLPVPTIGPSIQRASRIPVYKRRMISIPTDRNTKNEPITPSQSPPSPTPSESCTLTASSSQSATSDCATLASSSSICNLFTKTCDADADAVKLSESAISHQTDPLTSPVGPADNAPSVDASPLCGAEEEFDAVPLETSTPLVAPEPLMCTGTIKGGKGDVEVPAQQPEPSIVSSIQADSEPVAQRMSELFHENDDDCVHAIECASFETHNQDEDRVEIQESVNDERQESLSALLTAATPSPTLTSPAVDNIEATEQGCELLPPMATVPQAETERPQENSELANASLAEPSSRTAAPIASTEAEPKPALSSIQARIAAMYSSAGVAQPPAPMRPGARVCKFRAPDLLDKRASRDEQIQCEIEALRRIRRVDTGSHTIVKSVAFGGDGSAKPINADGKEMSLLAMGVLQRVRERLRKDV